MMQELLFGGMGFVVEYEVPVESLSTADGVWAFGFTNSLNFSAIMDGLNPWLMYE